MDKQIFQDRQHVSSDNLNTIYTDTESYFSETFSELLPVASTIISGGFAVTAVSPTPIYGVDISSGIGYDSNAFRMAFPVDATPSPYILTWMDNSLSAENRNDIVYVYGGTESDDLTDVFFMSATGTIYQQPIYQRADQVANFGVAIGANYGGSPNLGSYPNGNDPAIPSNALPLARIVNYPGATIIEASNLGSNAYVQADLRTIYPFTFAGGFKLENLSDVSISSVQNYQTIVWNSTTMQWQNSFIDISNLVAFNLTGTSVSKVVTHNLGYIPQVQVENSSGVLILPDSITHNSVNQFTVAFSFATSTNIQGNIIYN